MSDVEQAMITDLANALEAWRDVAMARWDLVEQLKSEKRQLAHEVERLKGETASAEYLESIGTGISEEYRPVYEALKGRKK